MVIAIDAMPNHQVYYYQESGLPLSFHAVWSDSMHEAHITFQELHAIGLMLCRMAFCLSGKMVALQLDNSTTKAYLCDQDVRVFLSLSRLACHILNLANKHGINISWLRQLNW